jgi:hypothetical protein
VQPRIKIRRDAKNPAACRQFIRLKLEWIELIFSILGAGYTITLNFACIFYG